MFPPARTALARAARSALSSLRNTHQHQLRRYSSQQPPSPTAAFYRTFTRPVAKCALLAVFVYQLAYFGWSKLEADEVMEEREAEIAKLEVQARSLQAAAQAAVAAASSSQGSGGEGGEKAEKGGSWWPWK
ncbi:hypothetical protein C8A05DRAFT_30776 [Staphylotrichum tortipilum]|uniref:Uncharacterized protein n=1 Tax=Staphylotrichum tortipilum TaxID=2831512 RepID=A0AAN6MRV0_9PEZI|nr:hypothetical protein C8A05DRAFT_30776 [Staphylotrichum longicolle]